MHTLHIFWVTFFNLCRLRLRPQDLPKSSFLLNITLAIYTVENTLVSLSQMSLRGSMILSLVETGLLVFWTSSLLYITGYTQRVNQTLAALAGANSLLGLFSLPIVYWLIQARAFHHNTDFQVLLLFGLLLWNLVVYAHVLRHALTVSFFVGSILTVITYSLTLHVLEVLFPLTI